MNRLDKNYLIEVSEREKIKLLIPCLFKILRLKREKKIIRERKEEKRRTEKRWEKSLKYFD